MKCRVWLLLPIFSALLFVDAPLFGSGLSITEGYQSAIDRYNQGKFIESQTLIYDLLDQNRASYLKPEFILLLAATYWKMGDAVQTDLILKGLEKTNPSYKNDPRFMILSASVFQQSEHWDKALAQLRHAATDHTLFQSAVIHEQAGQSFAALSTVNDLLKKFPNTEFTVPALVLQATSLSTLRQYESIGPILSASTVQKTSGLNNLAQYLVAQALLEQGEIEQGLNLLEQINSDEAQLLRGITLLKSQNYGLAESAFRKVLNSHDDRIWVRAALALTETAIRMNAPEKATEQLNSLLKQKKKNSQWPRLLLARGTAFFKSGQMPSALDDFDRVSKESDPDVAAQALMLMAFTLWSNGDFSRLVTDFQKSLADFRNRDSKKDFSESAGEALLTSEALIADAAFSLGRTRDAELMYSEMLKKPLSPKFSAQMVSGLVACLVLQQKFDQAEKQIDELLIRFGEDRDVTRFGLMAHAHLLRNRGEFQKAANQYQRFYEMFPHDDKAPTALYQWAICESRQKNSSRAVELWKELRMKYASSPWAFQALVAMADITQKSGKTEESQTYYRDLAQSNNSKAAQKARIQMAQYQLSRQQPELAIRTLSSSGGWGDEEKDLIQKSYLRVALTDPQCLTTLATDFAQSPHAGESYYHQGLMSFDAGRYEQAVEQFKTAWGQYPDTPSAGQALFYQAEAEFRSKKYQESVGTYRQFLQRYPNDEVSPVARLHRAKALALVGILQESVSAYEEVIDRYPQSSYAATALWELAEELHKSSQYEKEIPLYEQFIADFSSDEKSNTARYRLAQLFKRNGQYKEALVQFKQITPKTDLISEGDLKQMIANLEGLMAKAGDAP